MNFEQTLKEFNDLVKHGQELIEKLKQATESVKEADKNDIGALCKFWDDDPSRYIVGTLCGVDESGYIHPYCVKSFYGDRYKHCRRLSPSEVVEITGYKVEE